MTETEKTVQRKASACLSRRELLARAGGGCGLLALASLLEREAVGDLSSDPRQNPLAERPAHFPAKAKSVIFLFMYGGPSHIETFDYKPTLYPLDGKTIPVNTFGRGGKKNEGRVVGPKWKFKQYGQCGKWVSDLFPHVGTCVDDRFCSSVGVGAAQLVEVPARKDHRMPVPSAERRADDGVAVRGELREESPHRVRTDEGGVDRHDQDAGDARSIGRVQSRHYRR